MFKGNDHGMASPEHINERLALPKDFDQNLHAFLSRAITYSGASGLIIYMMTSPAQFNAFSDARVNKMIQPKQRSAAKRKMRPQNKNFF